MSLAAAAAELNPRVTAQSRPVPGEDQAANNAGGFVYALDNWSRLLRFLVLGTDGSTLYSGSHELTLDNAKAVIACLREDGPRAVREIVEVSVEGRAPKNDQAIFALALATVPAYADEATRRAAFDAVPKVCRTGTHLFQFTSFVDEVRGWGQGIKKAVASWYESQGDDDLGYQLVKYRQREGWTHRDVLRVTHPKDGVASGVRAGIYDWACGREVDVHVKPYMPDAIKAFERAQAAEGPADTVGVIRQYGRRVPREALKTEHLNDPTVWQALLEAGMPMTALIRNLGVMTSKGVLAPGTPASAAVVDALRSEDALAKARVHPIAVLKALMAYKQGRGVRGSLSWNPVAQVVDALDEAFYLSFGNVEPTGKRRLVAIDISGSMGWHDIANSPGLTPRTAAAAMAMVSLRSGDPTETVVFSAGEHGRRIGSDPRVWVAPGLVPRWGGGAGVGAVPLSHRQRLDDAMATIDSLPAGGTDCALPMLYAEANGREVDVFEVYTDNETWAGSIHPSQALRRYRQSTGIDAKLIVVGMTATGFSIADPSDAGMLDVVGFDSAAPQIMSDFARGLV